MKPFKRDHVLLLAVSLLLISGQAFAQAVSEYRVKAGFIYNFIAFTEWPSTVGSPLTLCVVGADPFGEELNALQGKIVGGRSIAIRRTSVLDQLKGCQVVFIAGASMDLLPRILSSVQGEPILTVADSPGALDAGVGINMELRQNRIAFEVNLGATRNAHLNLSSKLLRLAGKVRQ